MEPEKKRVKTMEEQNQEQVDMAELTQKMDEGMPMIEKRAAPSLQEFLDNPGMYDASSTKFLSGRLLEDPENNTALILAARQGLDKSDAFFAILEGKDSGYINLQNSKGVTALNVASHRGYVDYVRALLDQGKADVNIPNTSGSTSLIQAAHFGHGDVVSLLLEHGADVDKPNNKGTTALMRAAQEGHVEVVRLLLNSSCDVNKRNHERMNALMLASQRGHDQIVKMLIKNGADIDCQTVQGSTALMLACKRQHEAVVEVLLTAGAEIFITDGRGRTAIDTAMKRHHQKIVSLLQSHRQVRLMQAAARIERSYVMAVLYDLHNKKRVKKELIGNCSADKSTQALYRTFELPFSLFQCVTKYLPWPRMWSTTLDMLSKRCNIDPNEAIKGALSVIDEILTDMNFCDSNAQELHLIRIARNPEMQRLLHVKHNLPKDIISGMIEWNDVQSVLHRLERAVSFNSSIADKVVNLARSLYNWYKLGCHSSVSPRAASSYGAVSGEGTTLPYNNSSSNEEDDEEDHDNDDMGDNFLFYPAGAQQGGAAGGLMVSQEYAGFDSGSSDGDLD